MSKNEVKVSALSVLSVCEHVDSGKRKRGKGDRTRYDYYVPLVGAALPTPPPNAEKLYDMQKHILPFVPAQYKDDSIYALPTNAQVADARDIKKKRAQQSSAKAVSRTGKAQATGKKRKHASPSKSPEW